MAETMRRYIREHQISDAEFGKRVGIAESTIATIERGYKLPSVPTLQAFAELMQWTPGEMGQIILDLPDEPPPYLTYNSNFPNLESDSRVQTPREAHDGATRESDRTEQRDAGSVGFRHQVSIDQSPEEAGSLFPVEP